MKASPGLLRPLIVIQGRIAVELEDLYCVYCKKRAVDVRLAYQEITRSTSQRASITTSRTRATPPQSTRPCSAHGEHRLLLDARARKVCSGMDVFAMNTPYPQPPR
jgi:hypothetical protein